MDEYIGDGNAFATPDLWKTSTLADFNQDSTEPIELRLEPLGMPQSPGLHGCPEHLLTAVYSRLVEWPRGCLRHLQKP